MADLLALLDRLLTYGPRDERQIEGEPAFVVVPRPGTISPWSSKATNIAANCGLDAITRIERGIGFRVTTEEGAVLSNDDRAAIAPLLHDRMTETVFDDLAHAQSLFEHFPPRPLTTI